MVRKGTHISEEHKARISAARKGKKVSDEVKKRIGDSMKKTWDRKKSEKEKHDQATQESQAQA